MSAMARPYEVSIVCWFALELGLLARDLVREGSGPVGIAVRA